MLEWFTLVGSFVGGGAVFLTAAAFLLRRAVDQFLATGLATSKAALEHEADRHRHDLQREMVKVELAAGRVHLVYPRLFDKLERAFGAIAGLQGGGFAQSYEDHDRADIERALEASRLGGKTKARILSAFEEDRREGIQLLTETMRKVAMRDAQAEYRAERLKVSRATVYALIEHGALAATRVGLSLRIAVTAVGALMKRASCEEKDE